MADFDSQLPVRAVASQFAANLGQVNGTTTDVNTGNSSAGTQRVVLATDQPAVAVTGPAGGMGVDIVKVAGTATTVNTGNAGAGTMRVVLASDQPVVSINESQVSGTATDVNTGNASAGTQRVVLATNQPAVPVSITSAIAQKTYYQTATKAAAAVDTHTVSPAATEYFDGFTATGSGQIKAELKIGTTGGETTRGVWFSSKGHLDIQVQWPYPITIPNTDSVVLLVTNTDNQSQDVYSTVLTHS